MGQLLRLAELCVTVRSLEALFDGVVDVLGKTMGAGRIVPVLEEADLLRPYLASRHEFGQDLEAEGLNTALLERCRREGVAAASRDLGRLPSVACAPIRVGRRSHGVLYCERPGSASAFNRQDLAYLLTVAMQTGLGIENARSHQRMEQRARSLSRQLAERYSMVGESEAMQEVYRFIRKVAPTDAGVLICGESGTGKEVVARGIHSHSRRSEGPMEVVNCAAVPPALLESQLFGHVRGAFTGAVADTPGRFELADGGTLFLDEVVDLPVECQAKLLRALEEGRIRRVGDTRERGVSVRIIAATNRDPGAAVGEGRLRSDLFFRLDRLRIVLPPLRERKGDIPLLAGDFLTEFAAAMKRPAERLAPEVLRVFEAYGWPGNVRELKNAVERMVLLAEGSVLGLEHVPPDLLRAVREGPGERLEPLSEVERRHILRALESCRGNKTRAAEALGIDRSTLYARLRRYGIRA
ncbi:MAG: hypothetical protein AMK73_01585 [Planctomycetes bacterium SM23_32]|nr:MAG: hypothetical protein AMK73_01585 [Planctomycetes bacterium SM23_32]